MHSLSPSCTSAHCLSDTKDQLLLLWIVYSGGKHGVKIPFEYVVWCLPAAMTEGTISQHLAKLRQRMEADGHQVPPPIPRGSKHRKTVDSTSRGESKKSKVLLGLTFELVTPESSVVSGGGWFHFKNHFRSVQ